MPNRRMTFVECTPVHVEILAAIHQVCFTTNWSAEEFQELINAPAIFGLIALDNNNEPGGFILCQAVSDECEILTLGVLPQRRRTGIAARLLERIVLQMGRQACNKIFLEVAQNNEAAISLYAGKGFRKVGHRVNYYRRSESRSKENADALVLVKTLSRITD